MALDPILFPKPGEFSTQFAAESKLGCDRSVEKESDRSGTFVPCLENFRDSCDGSCRALSTVPRVPVCSATKQHKL